MLKTRIDCPRGWTPGPGDITATQVGIWFVRDLVQLPGCADEHELWNATHWGRGRYTIDDWLAFVLDVRNRGIRERVCVHVTPWAGSRIFEGNHRVHAAWQSGIEYAPVEFLYFGGCHTERLLTTED